MLLSISLAQSLHSKEGGGSWWLVWCSTGGQHGTKTGMVWCLGIDVAKPHGMDAKVPGDSCEMEMREERVVVEVEVSKGRWWLRLVDREVRRGGKSECPLRSRDCTHNIRPVHISTGKWTSLSTWIQAECCECSREQLPPLSNTSRHHTIPPTHGRFLCNTQNYQKVQTNCIAHPTHIPNGSL